MSVAYPNLVEQQLKLEQLLQRIEKRHKYGADSYNKSHLRRTPITSNAEAALLLKRAKLPLDTKGSGVPRDPRIELQRKRKLQNQLKYSPTNLKMNRDRSSAQIQIQNSKVFEPKAEVCSFLANLSNLF
jgi:hypothetical protein